MSMVLNLQGHEYLPVPDTTSAGNGYTAAGTGDPPPWVQPATSDIPPYGVDANQWPGRMPPGEDAPHTVVVHPDVWEEMQRAGQEAEIPDYAYEPPPPVAVEPQPVPVPLGVLDELDG